MIQLLCNCVMVSCACIMGARIFIDGTSMVFSEIVVNIKAYNYFDTITVVVLDHTHLSAFQQVSRVLIIQVHTRDTGHADSGSQE